MRKTLCPPTSPSLLPDARSLLKLKVRNNRRVGQAPTKINNKGVGPMSAPDDSYRTAPTMELIDDLLDNRAEVYERAKMELLVRLKSTKKEKLIELVKMEETARD